MQANSNCYCTSVVIKVPGIQGTGIIWETLTDEEKQEISDIAISPIREYVEESKTEVREKEANVINLAQQAEENTNTVVTVRDEVVNLHETVESQIASTGQTWVNNINTTGSSQVTLVTQEGTEQVANVTNEGQTQIEHIKAIINAEETVLGIRCYEARIEITEDIEQGSILTLPDPMNYFVGRDHLRMSWNGLILDRDVSFSEVGDKDFRSSLIQMDIPLKVGDILVAWTIPLGRGTTDELIERIQSLENALADLSRVVVYRE